MRVLKRGEKVTWVVETQMGNRIKMSTREGTVLSHVGDIVRVSWSGNTLEFRRASLRTKNQTSELTDLVSRMAGMDKS